MKETGVGFRQREVCAEQRLQAKFLPRPRLQVTRPGINPNEKDLQSRSQKWGAAFYFAVELIEMSNFTWLQSCEGCWSGAFFGLLSYKLVSSPLAVTQHRSNPSPWSFTSSLEFLFVSPILKLFLVTTSWRFFLLSQLL